MIVEAAQLAGWLLLREAKSLTVSAMVYHPVFEECGWPTVCLRRTREPQGGSVVRAGRT
jgi:hypothetical protein